MNTVKNNNPVCRHLSVILLTSSMLINPAFAADNAGIDDGYPDIAGTWLNNADSRAENISRYVIERDMQYLSGRYTDEQNGRVVMESSIAGLVDKQGGVIFDLYIGKITVTNRLVLSEDGKQLTGTFSTTMGNKGEVMLFKAE